MSGTGMTEATTGLSPSSKSDTDLTPEAIQGMIDASVAKAIAALPAGGGSADTEALKAWVRHEVELRARGLTADERLAENP